MKPLYPMPTHCPVSGEALEVTRLESQQSGVVIEGRFQPNEFALLENEHLEFMRLYIKVRGNLKDVERILGVSYPTVRVKFENMLKALGYEADVPKDVQVSRTDILKALETGEINAVEATKQLKALK